MATNKNALLRYLILDRCLSNPGKLYSIQTLLDEVNNGLKEDNLQNEGIGLRQLREDLKFMRSETGFQAPIETQKLGGKYCYLYSDTAFSINNSPLNTTEAEQIKSALAIIKRFAGSPQFEWIQEVSPILEKRLGLVKTDEPVISLESNVDYSGYRNIEPLFKAIVNRQVLNVTYHPYGAPAFDLIFHPHFLKQHNYRWFVIGYNQKRNIKTWNLALDRIENINPVAETFCNATLDWDELFAEIVGVTYQKDTPLTQVKLLFAACQKPYVLTKPLHQSQKNRILNSGELEVRIMVRPNYELETLILGFGEKVKVLEPKELKVKVAERLAQALKNYK